jgi:hypothetical protein
MDFHRWKQNYDEYVRSHLNRSIVSEAYCRYVIRQVCRCTSLNFYVNMKQLRTESIVVLRCKSSCLVLFFLFSCLVCQSTVLSNTSVSLLDVNQRSTAHANNACVYSSVLSTLTVLIADRHLIDTQ